MLFKKKIPKRWKGIDGLERKHAFQEKKFQNARKPQADWNENQIFKEKSSKTPENQVGLDRKQTFQEKKDPKPVQDSQCLDVNLSKYSFYVQKNEFYNVFWTQISQNYCSTSKPSTYLMLFGRRFPETTTLRPNSVFWAQFSPFQDSFTYLGMGSVL